MHHSLQIAVNTKESKYMGVDCHNLPDKNTIVIKAAYKIDRLAVISNDSL
jgi:hypothetical protein